MFTISTRTSRRRTPPFALFEGRLRRHAAYGNYEFVSVLRETSATCKLYL
jgi:hypothetical protein